MVTFINGLLLTCRSNNYEKMAHENALSMEGVKSKLKNLEDYLPNQEKIVYSFSSYLADRLNPYLKPAGFYMESQFALSDLSSGNSANKNIPIPSELYELPPIIYAQLSMILEDIVDSVCPKDFAQGVKEISEKAKKYQK